PYMSGFGGNLIVLLPNRVSVFRFADAMSYDPERMFLAGEAVRPFCTPAVTAAMAAPLVPLTAAELRAEGVGRTFASDFARVAAAFAGCASPPPSRPRDAGGPGLPVVSAARFDAGGPDAEEYGASNGYPIGARGTFLRPPFLVGSHSHLDEIFAGRFVRRATTPSRLARAASEPTLRYDYEGKSFTVDDYLARHPVTGFLIARDDTILVERYQYARNDQHRLTSWSMAKTVTAMLIGIAISEGRIRSVDDRADAYVPDLVGTEYGSTSLRHLLQMSSGVRFLEEYSGRDDVMQLARDTFARVGTGGVDV